MRIGAKLPNFGPWPAQLGVGEMARRLEAAGFDSIWVSDHVVIPARPRSRYPFSATGRASSSPATPWYDAVVSLTQVALATSRAEVGIGVLVLPMREPVTLAKQLATIDAVSGGRVALGAGAGWLAEEMEVLGVPFAERGRRMNEALAILRAVWTGAPEPYSGRHFQLPEGLGTLPRPAHEIPVLIGGMSEAALSRARTAGDGWFAFQNATDLDPGPLKTARRSGIARIVLRVAGDANSCVGRVRELADAGVDDLVIDVPWEDPAGACRLHDALRAAAG
jgi:probable F420-dependent oxidoreductase